MCYALPAPEPGPDLTADLIATRDTVIRAVRRSAPDRLLHARAVLDSLTLIDVTTSVLEQASRLDPTALRSLDAIHLAAALDLGDALDSIVTCDDRLAEATNLHRIPVTAPT